MKCKNSICKFIISCSVRYLGPRRQLTIIDSNGSFRGCPGTHHLTSMWHLVLVGMFRSIVVIVTVHDAIQDLEMYSKASVNLLSSNTSLSTYCQQVKYLCAIIDRLRDKMELLCRKEYQVFLSVF